MRFTTYILLAAVILCLTTPVFADGEITKIAVMANQENTFNLLDNLGGCTGLMNLPIFAYDATTKSILNTTSSISYAIDGALYSKAALTDQALSIASGFTGTVAAGYTRQFFMSLNSSGTLTTRSGDAATTVAAAAKAMPVIPTDEALVGMFQVTVNSDGATWTLGTSDFDAGSSSIILIDAMPTMKPAAWKLLEK